MGQSKPRDRRGRMPPPFSGFPPLVRGLYRKRAPMIIGLICLGTWWFAAGAFYLHLAKDFAHDAWMDRPTLLLNASLWPLHLFPYLIGTKHALAGNEGAGFRRMLRCVRIVLIIGALACMGVIWRDLTHKLDLPIRKVATAPRISAVDESPWSNGRSTDPLSSRPITTPALRERRPGGSPRRPCAPATLAPIGMAATPTSADHDAERLGA